MNVQIRRIGPEGVDLQESFPVEFIELTQKDVLHFVEPFDVKANVIRAEDEVVVRITAKSCFESFCSRCLEEVKQDWRAEYTLTFDAKEYAEFIEMDEDIRQELVLNLPARILCQADCKGLCIDCGTNLNKKKCTHKHAVLSVASDLWLAVNDQ